MNKVIIVWWIVMCIWGSRDLGYMIDKQSRDIKGKPMFVKIPDKYKFLFKLQKNSYFEKNNPLRESIAVQSIGYMFAIMEIAILFLAMSSSKFETFIKISTIVYVICALIQGLGFVVPSGIRYEQNLQKSYDYDWITFLQEVFIEGPKRKCKIISRIDDNIYEIIVVGSKKKYRAKCKFPVTIGSKMYAVHIYPSNNANDIYWEIRKH